ncbi:hypothetical protein QYM36_012062 [Artemia franciscana]|uniref:Uncharacterized protein n=1 Tax=Artemia franciscana TaxID=6661 RepID=A0AA88L2Y1_ARTSF|nr:hypothetical protein QYM36_012062 [Artemia franciscana]
MFHLQHIKVTVVTCYAPTNDAEEVVLKNVSMTLITKSPRIYCHDMVIFAGDFKDKIGNDRSYYPEVLGPHGLGNRNENGVALIDFTFRNHLPIGGTRFHHKNIHKYTWASPDATTRK